MARGGLVVISVVLAAAVAVAACAAPAGRAWMNRGLTADARAELILRRMSLDEQIALLTGDVPQMMKNRPPGVTTSAGYVAGVPRLGIPALAETDASLGVANAGRSHDDAVALPSGLAIAATWNPQLAFQGGAMIGKEARRKGFNVLLGGGVNLVREPRNGRNFEYLGEDPLLAGEMDGAAVRGVESQGVISTIKHFALNDQEVGRMVLDAHIDEASFRESDLLAFEIAIEAGQPGSVMCAYNRVGGPFACEDDALLNGVLKRDWGYRGWVMSDWGAVHSTASANAGLDQESGKELDTLVSGHTSFDAPLSAAVARGEVSPARVRDMARRILRGMFSAGLFDRPPAAPGGLDTASDTAVARRVAEQAIVLLVNRGGLLPLAAKARRIAVIGGHADAGVFSGGGSSQVTPLGSTRLPAPKGAPFWIGGMFLHPSSPLAAIRARAGDAQVVYSDRQDPPAAAALARGADVAIVFADQWATEGADVSLTLPGGQDRLIAAVAAANPRTIVVLETGGPVLMPWLDKVGAVLEAWYPGSGGGEAIAEVLFGQVDPSGRLPVSFPASEAELPRPQLPGARAAGDGGMLVEASAKPFRVDYTEGSDVGYRWYGETGAKPLFPFGYGLSYSHFRYGGLKVSGGAGALTVSFEVANTGERPGTETAQAYLLAEPSRRQQRLIGWSRVTLAPGERRQVVITAPPRLLANWSVGEHRWRIETGSYRLAVGPDAATPTLTATARLSGSTLAP
jgi:beta-glucosidase